MSCDTVFSTEVNAKGDITCKRADTFNLYFSVSHLDDASPHDLTVYDSITMSVKLAPKDPTYVLEFSLLDGTLVVYDTNKIQLTQKADDMKIAAQTYLYDAEGAEGTVITTLFGGSFTITDDVTRDSDVPV